MCNQRLGDASVGASRIALGMTSYGDDSRRAWHLDKPL
jgi:hypothetical protein